MDSGHAGSCPHANVGVVRLDRLPVVAALVGKSRRRAALRPCHHSTVELTTARPPWPAGQIGPRTRSNTVVRWVTELSTSLALAASVSRASWLA